MPLLPLVSWMQLDFDFVLWQTESRIGLLESVCVPRAAICRLDIEAKQKDAGKGKDLSGCKVAAGTESGTTAKGPKGNLVVLLFDAGISDEALVVELVDIGPPCLR